MKSRKEKFLPAILPTDTEETKVFPNFLFSFEYEAAIAMFPLLSAQIPSIGGSTTLIFRDEPRPAAFVREVMEAWSSEYVRASLSSNMQRMLFHRVFENTLRSGTIGIHIAPNEVIPGLTAKQLLKNILQDEQFLQRIDFLELETLLVRIYSQAAISENDARCSWSYLTAKDRIELLDLSHDWNPPKTKFTRANLPEFFTNTKTTVRHIITGTTTQTLLEMYNLVCEENMQMLASPPDERTVTMIKKIRNAMILQMQPSIAAYHECISICKRFNPNKHILPEVLNAIISGYAFQPQYIWASRNRKGLTLLQDDCIFTFAADCMNFLEETNQHTLY